MLGAIAGDVIGSVHEFAGTKTMDFELFAADCSFTDDTVLAVAVADCLLHGHEYAATFRKYFFAYPAAGYGGKFLEWASSHEPRGPYNSWGNGSAMRVPAVAYAFDSLEKVVAEAERSARVTHNHPEGVKGAQATAAAIFMARGGDSKMMIKNALQKNFGYDLGRRLDDIRPVYEFDESCQGTVPPAIIAFLESSSYEDAVRKAISLGGDADTLACITGGIAEAYYGGVPSHIATGTLSLLDDSLRAIVIEFGDKYQGTLRRSLQISPYDAQWPNEFQRERDRISQALGHLARRIDHHGSTAVPGLDAKPIIDIQVSVNCLQPLHTFAAPLAAIGYVHMPHPDDVRCPFFHRPGGWPHSHHVHVVQVGGEEERRTLAFRDFLREHGDVSAEYARLKRKLAERYAADDAAEREAYAAAKSDFVERVVRMALEQGYPR